MKKKFYVCYYLEKNWASWKSTKVVLEDVQKVTAKTRREIEEKIKDAIQLEYGNDRVSIVNFKEIKD
jgi:hypothetical protein